MPALADERKVAAPRVDAEAFHAGAFEAIETPAHLEPEPQDVPLERAVLPDRFVRETMDFANVQKVRAQPADNGTAALSTEIEC